MLGRRHDDWGLSKAKELPTISSSLGMCPRVNGEAVRGRSHLFSAFQGSFSLQLYILGWESMAEVS